MTWLYEALFCPQHGLLKPDNFMAIWATIQVSTIHARFYLTKWFGI
jgi:hypothetical protein